MKLGADRALPDPRSRRWIGHERPVPTLDAESARAAAAPLTAHEAAQMATMSERARTLRERADRLVRRACRYERYHVKLRAPEVEDWIGCAPYGHGGPEHVIDELAAWLEADGFVTELLVHPTSPRVAGPVPGWRCCLEIRW